MGAKTVSRTRTVLKFYDLWPQHNGCTWVLSFNYLRRAVPIMFFKFPTKPTRRQISAAKKQFFNKVRV